MCIDQARDLASTDKITERVTLIKQYFNCFEHMKINKPFAIRMVLCEMLNVINLAVQIYVTNVFLNYQFISLGPKLFKRGLEFDDYLAYVFPKVAKCDFYKFGPSGSIQIYDALCVMPLNVINDKIYLIIWFWYCFMIVVTIVSILWRIASFIFHSR